MAGTYDVSTELLPNRMVSNKLKTFNNKAKHLIAQQKHSPLN